MTLVAAWIRKLKASEELVVVSDSRLTSGMTWDEGPKLFPLSRGDSVIAFAGETAYAYPMLLQLLHSIDDFQTSRSRAMSLEDMKGCAERQASSLLSGIQDLHPRDQDIGKHVTLLLAGYSCASGRFRMWVSKHDPATKALSFVPPQSTIQGACFIGSGAKEARDQLRQLLRKKGKLVGHQKVHYDWEPFEVLRDLVRSKVESSVGGAPQVVKVYKHLNVMPLAVMWPKRGQTITLLGRRLLDYERTQRFALDPDTLSTVETWHYDSAVFPEVKVDQQRESRKGGTAARGTTSRSKARKSHAL